MKHIIIPRLIFRIVCSAVRSDLLIPIRRDLAPPSAVAGNLNIENWICWNWTSRILSFCHSRESTRSWMKISSSFLLMRWRTNQRCKRSFHKISFNTTNSHKRIRHSRSTRVESILRIRSRCGGAWTKAFVKTTPKRTRMRRRRTHASSFRLTTTLFLHTGSWYGWDRPVRWNWTV